MADKPSRALVIYGDGFAPLVTSCHSNLHEFATLACCGFLALRDSPPSEIENEREVRELAQLLDTYDYYTSSKEGRSGSDAEKKVDEIVSTHKIADRFKGVRAALITSSSSIRTFAREIGFTVLQVDDIIMQSCTSNESPKSVADLSMITKLAVGSLFWERRRESNGDGGRESQLAVGSRSLFWGSRESRSWSGVEWVPW